MAHAVPKDLTGRNRYWYRYWYAKGKRGAELNRVARASAAKGK